jgi:hypothetical protein
MTSIFSRHRAVFFRRSIVIGGSARLATVNAAITMRTSPQAFLEKK